MKSLARLLFALLICCAPVPCGAHSGAPIPVILDTDMALDDVRAIALLSGQDGIQVIAAVSSDGSCAPAVGAANLRRVLSRLGWAEVPVAAGRDLGAEGPAWRPLAESLGGWAGAAAAPESSTGASGRSAVDLLRAALEAHDDVVYLCMGPLTNLADLLAADPLAARKLARIQYWGSARDAAVVSWNIERDPGSARQVFAAGLPLSGVMLPDERLLTFDRDMADAVCALGSPAAILLCEIHASSSARGLVDQGHFRCWDETAVLDLLFPELFTWNKAARGQGLERAFDLVRGRRRYLELLAGELSMRHGHRHPVVLRAFPEGPDQLQADVAAIAEAALARHGQEEWNAVLLTNELHQHLGLYSILGAKMGIRARELLDAGLDELSVVSLAGAAPPLSCLTDGLQVATGATLGRGAITVQPGAGRPAARFTKGDRSVELGISDEVVAQIRADIQACIAEHGDLTPEYWDAVRVLALRCWLEMDRAVIFHTSKPDTSR